MMQLQMGIRLLQQSFVRALDLACPALAEPFDVDQLVRLAVWTLEAGEDNAIEEGGQGGAVDDEADPVLGGVGEINQLLRDVLILGSEVGGGGTE